MPKMDGLRSVDQLSLQGRSWRLILIVWTFVVIIGCLLGFTYLSIGLMSAGRAFVGGEGLWSKAQKDAVAALSHYAMTHDAKDYQAYQDALVVNLGDRRARLELEKPEPDYAVAFQGLVDGRNHVDDVNGMIRLFRSARQLSEFNQAVAAWKDADRLIDQLIQVGNRLHSEVIAGTLDTKDSIAYQHQIRSLDAQITPFEDGFSYALGELSRKTKSVLQITMLVVFSVLLAIAFLISRRIVQSHENLQKVLVDNEAQLRKLLQFAPIPIFVVSVEDESFVYANQRALDQFKMTEDKLQATKPSAHYVRPEDRTQILQALQSEGALRDHEVELLDGDGCASWYLLSTQRITFQGKECLFTALNNIEDRKRAHEALSHRAFHDELTGLPNRAMFMDALSRTLARMERKGGMFCVLFIDLDHFKDINDNLGHAVGDLVLQEVAKRVRTCVREGDLVARLGGDEFVVLIEGENHADDGDHVALNIIKALEPTFVLDDCSLQVTASIGVSSYPKNGLDTKDLLKHADAAMYGAKRDGGSRFGHLDLV